MKLSYIVGAVVVVAALIFFGVLSPQKIEHLKCKWRQQAATSTLKEIASRIATANAKGKPTGSFADLAWYPKDHSYEYLITPQLEGRFDVEARAVNNNGDVWHIDETQTLRNSVDGCYAGTP